MNWVAEVTAQKWLSSSPPRILSPLRVCQSRFLGFTNFSDYPEAKTVPIDSRAVSSGFPDTTV